jgi:iron complex transport system ATP-binding protein
MQVDAEHPEITATSKCRLASIYLEDGDNLLDRMSTPMMPSRIAKLAVEMFERDGIEILRDVELTIERGQRWAILGANGSGKTTLVRILAGMEWPSRGSVEVLGKRFGGADLRALRKQIGFVSVAFGDRFPAHGDALSVVLSGFDASVGLWRPPSSDEIARARRALDDIGAGGLAMRQTGVLSQGERQRVLVARALVHRPALLVLDEPCASLDPLARERLLDDLGRLAALPDAPAIVHVTHHVEEIAGWVTHALLLAAGRVVAAGPVGATLSSEHLTRTYGAPAELVTEGGRYHLRFTPRT